MILALLDLLPVQTDVSRYPEPFEKRNSIRQYLVALHQAQENFEVKMFVGEENCEMGRLVNTSVPE
jgi:hypothetical protein